MIDDKQFTFSEFISNHNEVFGELLTNNTNVFKIIIKQYNIFRGLTKKD